LVRQPQNLGEAIATVHMLDSKGYNYSVGIAQVNRANLGKYGLTSYEQAFGICPNLTVGARILSECYASSGNDWGKSFSCYYSGNFVTGYVQKVYDSINGGTRTSIDEVAAIPLQTPNISSPSDLHGALTSVSPIIATDSASYRLAIRSTVLENATAAATPSIANTLSPEPASEPQRSSTAAASTNLAAQPATPAAATNDVFVPQVRNIGDPPQAVAATSIDSQPPMASATAIPTIPAADQADLRKGSADSAFVF
jgi:type IV secretion system protein VirB1